MLVFDCSCGKKDVPLNQKEIHKRNRAHVEWETLNGLAIQTQHEAAIAVMETDDDDVGNVKWPNPLPEIVQQIVKLGQSEPVAAARAMRQYKLNHPRFPGTVREFLVGHNIPIIDVPKSMCTESDANKYMQQRVAEYRARAVEE